MRNKVNGLCQLVLVIGMAQLMLFYGTCCCAESAETVHQSQSQVKRLSKAQLNSSLEKIHDVLSGPDTAGSRIQSKAIVEALILEGNEALPRLSGFLDSDKVRKRKFAYEVLANIDTDESMGIINDKFFALYSDKTFADKITVVGAAGSYQSETISVDIQGVRNYWEARTILLTALHANSKRAIPMCLGVYKDPNGVGVIASKYLWLKNGKEFMPIFVAHSQSSVETEPFYTFVKEFSSIFGNDEQDSYIGIEQAKTEFKQKALSVVLNPETSESVLWELIEYLSNAEPDWFADNWVGLFKAHKKATYPLSHIRTAILRGVSNNKASRKHIGELKDILNEHDYNFFKESIEKRDIARQEKAKWENKTK